MKYIFRNICFVSLLLLMAGCMKETEIESSAGGGDTFAAEDVTVRMTLNIPDAADTRALSTAQESAVNTVDVLVFDKNLKFVDWQYGQMETEGGNVAYSVIVRSSRDADDTFRIMTLANVRQTTYALFGRGEFEVNFKGTKSYTEVVALLKAEMPDYADLATGGIPMWGETENLILIDEANRNYNIDLLRSLARIDVGTNSNPTFGATGQITGWTALSNFKLKKVHVYNAGTEYALTARTNYSFTNKSVSTYTIPATNDKASTPAEYTVTNDVSLTGEIYAGESDVKMGGDYGDAHHDDRMAVVVAGYYSPDPATPNTTTLNYYRLDFREGTNGSTLMDILRNHDYQIVIRSVSGPGKPTEPEAWESINADMTAVVKTWSNATLTGTVFDGENWLKATPYDFDLDKWARTDEPITIETNVPATAGKSWSATIVRFADTDADPATWITLTGGTTATGVSGDEVLFSTENFTGAPTESRKARLRITAGTMTYDVVIAQSGKDGDHLLRLSTGELLFAGRKWNEATNTWENPDPQSVNINWGPRNNPYEMTLSDYQGGGVDLVDLDANTPTDSEDTEYAVSPELIVPDDPHVVADPFFERISRLSFSAYDATGSNPITKTVRIRQIFYSLVVERTYDYYFKGRSYSFRVRSNSPWVATTDNPGMFSGAITTSSQGNTAGGTTLKFTVNPNAEDGEVANITISSPEHLFPPQTFTITAADVLPNSYLIAPGSNRLIPVEKAYHVWKYDRDLKDLHSGGDLPTGTYGAKLVWQDVPDMITGVTFTGSGRDGQISVQTAPDLIGNAVVAFTIDDVVYWSWHIWVTDYDPETDNIVNGAYTLMDRNIGADTDDYGTVPTAYADVQKTFGLFYQAGRKDPFPRNSRTNIIQTMPRYDIGGVALPTITGNSQPAPAGVNLDNAIKNPEVYYRGTYGEASWYAAVTPIRYALWDNYVKSDFDPCPEGWRVGGREAYYTNGVTPLVPPAPLGNSVSRGGFDLSFGYFPQQNYMDHMGTIQNNGYAYLYRTTAEPYSPANYGVGTFYISPVPTAGYGNAPTRSSQGCNLRCVKE